MMESRMPLRIFFILICFLFIAACGGSQTAKNYNDPSGKVKNAPYVINSKRYVPLSVTDAKQYAEVGVASWYGSEMYHNGRVTAIGEKFSEHGISAAHCTLPLPVWVKVTNLENGRHLLVRVNDRGPFKGDRIIDLSKGAAHKLGFVEQGTAKVRVEFVSYD